MCVCVCVCVDLFCFMGVGDGRLLIGSCFGFLLFVFTAIFVVFPNSIHPLSEIWSENQRDISRGENIRTPL